MAPYIITRCVSALLLLAGSGSTAFAPATVPRRRCALAEDAPSCSSSPSDGRQQLSPSTSTRRRRLPRRHPAATTTTILRLSSRDNDRARMEKSWENMMGEDWREFRARLVARERASVGGETTSSPGDQKKQQQRQQSTAREDASSSSSGGIFGAITSMFSNKGGGESSSSSSSSDAATATRARRTRGKDDPPADIFDGDAVGGATRFSKIGMSSSSYSACSDPFMDEEECHIIYDEPNVKIDKHRWAHPLFHVEPGCILVANEKLGGVFHQTVVLIIDHNEAAGSTGMVINRPFPGNLIKIASDGESNIDLSLKMAFGKATVAYGGPVMQDQFSTLHGFGEVMGSKKVCPGVFVGGSSQLIQEVRRNNLRPTEVLFVKGHAAWVPGQLTREIEKGVWYLAAASADLILRYAGAPVLKDDNPSDLWADILSCMGDKFVNIATAHSGRGDERMLP